ncbi:MAG TPA: dihydropteroate synthase [Firmicutes bacterium]|nr:dihydropteroate synthase [Bacillota bacterium]
MQRMLVLGKHKLPLGSRTLIMGILNITPDSFSDGGKYLDQELALEQGIKMAEQGADIIDVGGESTRPGHTPVAAEEELSRVIPVVEKLAQAVDVPVSIDTYKAKVAEAAVRAGALMINDVWGFKKDPGMAKIAARLRVPVCLMHNRPVPEYNNLIVDMLADLQESINIAQDAGVEKEKIIIDPGIGFAKNLEESLEVMRHLKTLKLLGYPVLLGTSRKSLIGKTLGLPVEERLEGTAATVAYGITMGVDIVRVHDVMAQKRVVDMTDAIVRGRYNER